jgi:minor extracellular serine protease Vpr
MKKTLFLLLVLMINSLIIFSQNNCSPLTQKIILQTEKNKGKNMDYVLNNKCVERYAIQKTGNNYFIGALIEVDKSDFKEQDLLSLGGKVNTKIGNIWSVQLPVENLKKLRLLSGLIYVEAGGKAMPCLDQARTETRVNLVNSGFQLPLPYKGQGIIVGVVDIGLDFTHPMFKDSTGNSLRISRAWIQNDTTGTAPYLFSYGSEYIGTTPLLNKGTDDANSWHGTHVTGIAAGSGFGSNGLYSGVAPEAEIVQVGLDFNSGNLSHMVDAFSYICHYADSVNKPAIVNMSLAVLGDGSLYDGNTLFERSLNSLITDRHILVVAAGNFGSTNLHVEKNTIPVTDTLTSLFLAAGWDAVSIWSDPNSGLSTSVSLYDSTGTKLIQTPVYQTINNPSFTEDYPIPSNNDTVTLSITSQHLSVLNDRSSFYIVVESKGNRSYFCSFSATADSGNIHAWDQPFNNFTNSINGIVVPGAKSGDNYYTLGAPGTVERAITVGAYTTKNSYTYLSGVTEYTLFNVNIGEFAPFSSNGPGFLSANMKPTITAPGNTLVSAVNSFDTSFNDSSSVMAYNNHWYYAPAFGTSMACPMVTGIIALMYQANPMLTRNQVESIIKQSARQDSFTGVIPSDGNSHWGWGKIDAYSAVSLALTTGINNNYTQSENIHIYPNPSSYNITIINTNAISKETIVSIYNVAGQQIISEKFHAEKSFNIDVSKFPKGLYLVKVNIENVIETRKLIVQ